MTSANAAAVNLFGQLLNTSKWLSVHQLTIYYALFLWWKTHHSKKPARLLQRTLRIQKSEARLFLTERIWSRTTERHYKFVENKCTGVTKISNIKMILSDWVKANIPIKENDD